MVLLNCVVTMKMIFMLFNFINYATNLLCLIYNEMFYSGASKFIE